MSQIPSKIWLHKDTKYSTGDIVCGYQYDFVQGIEDEGGIENFVEYVPADAFIEKVSEWLKDNASNYIINTTPSYPDADFSAFIGGKCWEDLKQAMKDETENL